MSLSFSLVREVFTCLWLYLFVGDAHNLGSLIESTSFS